MPPKAEFVLNEGRYGGPAFTGLVDPAVLIVDMTNDFGHPDGVYMRNGAVCSTFPDAVTAARRVVECAERVDIPTISAAQVIYRSKDGVPVTGGGLVEGRPWLKAGGFEPGSWGTQLVDELPRPDFTIEKPRASAFYASALEVLLRGLQVRTLIVAGCYTDQCVTSTVRDAWARDFQVVIASDAVAAFDERLHQAALDSMKPLATQLTSTELANLLAP